jgi:AbrB family looped-hinge helix DNA binding protein
MMDKGLVVVPKKIREELGLSKGDKVIFVKLGRSVAFFRASEDPIKESRGILSGGGTMAEYLEDKRRELEEEEKDLPPPRNPQ